jgi:hypothetical protein
MVDFKSNDRDIKHKFFEKLQHTICFWPLGLGCGKKKKGQV